MEIPRITLRRQDSTGKIESKSGQIILWPWEVPDKPQIGLPDDNSPDLSDYTWVDENWKEVLKAEGKYRSLSPQEVEQLF